MEINKKSATHESDGHIINRCLSARTRGGASTLEVQTEAGEASLGAGHRGCSERDASLDGKGSPQRYQRQLIDKLDSEWLGSCPLLRFLPLRPQSRVGYGEAQVPPWCQRGCVPP